LARLLLDPRGGPGGRQFRLINLPTDKNSTSRQILHTLPRMHSIKLLGAGLISTFLIAAPILSTRQALPTAEVTLDVQRESVNVFGLDGQGSGVLFHRFGKTYVLTAA